MFAGANVTAGAMANPQAVNDIVATTYDKSVTVDVLKNDIDMTSCGQMVVDTVAGSGLRKGTLTINADKTLTYVPDRTKFGIDSVEYSVRCGTDAPVKAKV
jgi:hypothetical protein